MSQERIYTVRLRIIYNKHNARLRHDHVTVINFSMIPLFFTLLNMRVIILVNILYCSFISRPPG